MTTQEENQICTRLRELELKVERLIAVKEKDVIISRNIHDDQAKMIKRHEEILLGTDRSRGLVTRVSHVEDRDTARTWNLRALWLGFISVFGMVFAAIITNAMF